MLLKRFSFEQYCKRNHFNSNTRYHGSNGTNTISLEQQLQQQTYLGQAQQITLQ
jgi:hypothetical protein